MMNNRGLLRSLTKTELRTRIRNGETYVDIGLSYGVSRQAVFQRAQAFGLAEIKSNLLEKRNQKIVKLRKKNPVMKIAQLFDLSTAQVYFILRNA